jgi:hypothetical protein
LFGYFNAKLGREYIFKPPKENESLREIHNDNEVRLAKYVTSKNRINNKIFSHRNIHKYIGTSPDGKTRNQIEYVLVDEILKYS